MNILKPFWLGTQQQNAVNFKCTLNRLENHAMNALLLISTGIFGELFLGTYFNYVEKLTLLVFRRHEMF